jgi:gamma-tubulin complex component 2
MVPIFLAKYKEKVMHSGKYLYVIRECGRDIKYPYEKENILQGILPIVNDQSLLGEGNVDQQKQIGNQLGSSYDFFEPIEKAYQWSSQKLLEVIFKEC